MNKASETGLPYDIEVYHGENQKEYIEVKTADSANKYSFEILAREWPVAALRGAIWTNV